MSSSLSYSRVILMLLLIALYESELCWAGGFQVYPIRVFLNASESSTLMTVKNDSAERLRLQIGVMAWDQNKQGEMVLNPTDDIIFYPTLLTINPGDQRNLRVGTHTKEHQRKIVSHHCRRHRLVKNCNQRRPFSHQGQHRYSFNREKSKPRRYRSTNPAQRRIVV
jgi:hypothetical protein